MCACLTFFEAAVNILWSIIHVGMALVAALLAQTPERPPAQLASPVVAMVSGDSISAMRGETECRLALGVLRR